MLKPGVKVTVDKTADVEAQIKALVKSHVLVGIPAESPERTPDEGEPVVDNPITNAEIGYVMEFGMPEQNIPARAFLVPGVTETKERVAKVMKDGAVKALKGDKTAADMTMNKAGLIASTSVKNKINDGPFDPLKDSTIAARKRRGREGTKPLIDTGQLRNSVTYVVKAKGK